MTSSLVGSEMCIRDRCLRTTSTSARAFSTARRRKARRGLPQPSSLVGPACLLYTSDAADDM
eukprot:6208735-Prorocentrum_lima.AAC.1